MPLLVYCDDFLLLFDLDFDFLEVGLEVVFLTTLVGASVGGDLSLGYTVSSSYLKSECVE